MNVLLAGPPTALPAAPMPPAGIDLSVDLPRPRDRGSRRFLALKEHALAHLLTRRTV